MSDKGYAFPEPVDPGELACFKVYVPKHSLYLAAFWRAYEFFATWNAWMRDPLKRGKDVAQVWRKAFDKARKFYEETRGECMPNITNIRQDPLDPCRVQVQYDGGPTWVQVLDMSCCGGGGGGGCVPPLRVGTNGAIESYDPDTGTWSDTAPTITQANGENYPPVFPGDPEAQCKAANGYYEFLKDTEEKILDAALEAGNWGDYALEIMAWLAIYFNLPGVIFQQAVALLQVAYDLSGAQTEARLAARDDADFFCEVFTHTGGDGTYSEARLAALRADLYDKADGEANDDIKWWYVHAADLVGIMGLTGANKGAAYVVAEPNDCTSCEWIADIDFTVDTGGFKAMLVDRGTGLKRYGQWEAGVGWKTTQDGPAGTPYQNSMQIELPIDTTTVSGIVIRGQVDPEGHGHSAFYPPAPNTYTSWHATIRETPTSPAAAGDDFPYSNAGEAGFEFDSSITPDQWQRITIFANINSVGSNPGWGFTKITSIQVRGTGAVPPELANYLSGGA